VVEGPDDLTHRRRARGTPEQVRAAIIRAEQLAVDLERHARAEAQLEQGAAEALQRDLALVAALASRLRRARAHQLFMRVLGPGDVVHAVARVCGADNREISAIVRGENAEHALLMLLRGLDEHALTLARSGR
jgi:hypothetical protein